MPERSPEQRVTRVDLSDLGPDEVRAVSAAVCVARNDGRVFAFARRCTHEGADLAGGYVDELGRLRCPWHHLAFQLETGEQTCASLRNLRVYAVREVADGVYEIEER